MVSWSRLPSGMASWLSCSTATAPNDARHWWTHSSTVSRLVTFPNHLDPELAAAALAGAVMYRRLMTATPLSPDDAEPLNATVLGPQPPRP